MRAPWLEYQSVSSARSALQTCLRHPFIGQSHHDRRHSLRAQSLLEIRYEMSSSCSLQALRLVIAICINRTVFCVYDGSGTSLKSTQDTMMAAGVQLMRKPPKRNHQALDENRGNDRTVVCIAPLVYQSPDLWRLLHHM